MGWMVRSSRVAMSMNNKDVSNVVHLLAGPSFGDA